MYFHFLMNSSVYMVTGSYLQRKKQIKPYRRWIQNRTVSLNSWKHYKSSNPKLNQKNKKIPDLSTLWPNFTFTSRVKLSHRPAKFSTSSSKGLKPVPYSVHTWTSFQTLVGSFLLGHVSVISLPKIFFPATAFDILCFSSPSWMHRIAFLI